MFNFYSKFLKAAEPTLLFNQAVELHRNKNYDQAIALYAQAIEKQKDYYDAHYNLGTL